MPEEVRREMLTIILTITTAICAFGWLVSRISAIAMIRYVKIKGYERPTNAELNECIRWAAKEFLKELVMEVTKVRIEKMQNSVI